MERLAVLAVAQRLPGWAEDACADYLRHMPRGFETRRIAVKPEARTAGRPGGEILLREAQRLRAAVPADAVMVALDERGKDLSTREFAALLRRSLDGGDRLAFLIGGPDGLDATLKSECRMLLRLSSLTLPHALAQLLLCEQLYRCAQLLTGHPYHRD